MLSQVPQAVSRAVLGSLRASAAPSLRAASPANYSPYAPTQRVQLNNVNSLTLPTHFARYYADAADVTVNVPDMGDSITEGTVQWQVAEGDEVAMDDVIAIIETEKVELDIRAPESGVLKTQLSPDDSDVRVGEPLYVLTPGEGSGSSAPAAESTPAPAKEEAAPASSAPASSAPASTPAPAKDAPKDAPAAKSTPAPEIAAAPARGNRTEEVTKMSRMRSRIAERLKDSQNTAAMLTTFNEIDMTNLIALRNKHKDAFLKKHGIKLGFMSPFVKAASSALAEYPIINSVIDGNQVVHRNYHDVSVAVAAPKGLVVPVIRNVEDMSFADVEKAIANFGQKAKDGTLAIEEMTGGTFTISNGGTYGSMMGTPIINLPQSAILGMHATKDRPYVVDGEIKVRAVMYIALTYDHRLIDGREAVLFLRKIKEVIEEPEKILFDL